MKLSIRKVLTNVRRRAKLLLPPSKDIPKTGRKGFRRHALLTALVLGFLRGIVAERGLEKYLREHNSEARLCDLKEFPSDTTIGRVKGWLAPEMLEAVLNAAIKQLAKHLGRRVLFVVIDDSPLEAYRRSDKDASWGYSETRGWFYGYKIHAAVDAISGLPLAVIVTSGREVGMNYLPALLRKVRENGMRFRCVIADAGYDSEANYEAVLREFRAIPVIKRNERNTKHGAAAKQDSLRNACKGLGYGCKIWEKVYGLRGAVERLFSLAKDTLKLKQHKQQGLRSVTLLVLIVLLAILLFALTALKLGLQEFMLKVGTFVYR